MVMVAPSGTGASCCPSLMEASSISLHRRLGLLRPAVGEQPAGAFGEITPDEQDHDREYRTDQEAQPPAGVRRQRVEQQERGQRADDRSEPVAAVDPDVGASAVAGGHHLIDGRVDGRVLAADTGARDEAGGVEENEPAGPFERQRREAGADQVDRQGPHEQLAASEFVRQPAEHQRSHDFADQVDGADRGCLRRGQVQRAGLGELAGHRAGDRDLQAVQDPGRAESQHQPGMERRPSQPVQPRRYGAADRLLLLLLRGHGSHSRLPLSVLSFGSGLVSTHHMFG